MSGTKSTCAPISSVHALEVAHAALADADVQLVGELQARAAGGLRRRPAGELAALEQHDVRDAAQRQLEGGRRADRAATDDDHLCGFHGGSITRGWRACAPGAPGTSTAAPAGRPAGRRSGPAAPNGNWYVTWSVSSVRPSPATANRCSWRQTGNGPASATSTTATGCLDALDPDAPALDERRRELAHRQAHLVALPHLLRRLHRHHLRAARRDPRGVARVEVEREDGVDRRGDLGADGDLRPGPD